MDVLTSTQVTPAQWFNISAVSAPLPPLENSTEMAEILNDRLQMITNYITYTNSNLDDFFFVVNGVLVLLMQVGFACLEAGSIRSKNVTNIMLKNFLDTLICSIMFWLTGWAIAFGTGNAFLGWTEWAGVGIGNDEWSVWFFQFTFASTASTILSGSVAERSTFVTYLSYSFLMSGVFYPVVVHWAWSPQGWLKDIGFVDYAGGMLIHGLAGSACLVAAVTIGPRIGRFQSKNGKSAPIDGHSTAMVGTGAIIILVGFCGFNAGTLSHFSKEGDGYTCVVIVRNTILGGAGGALLVLFAGKIGAFGNHYWPFAFTVNGGICGLVASCAGCNIFSPAEGLVTGIFAGIVYIILHHIMLYMEVDDPMDSGPVHFGGGVWSVFSIPLIQKGSIFANPLNEVLQELLIQAIGAASIMIWSILVSILLFGTLKILNLLRSNEEEELIGSDVSKHNEPAYTDAFVVSPKDLEDGVNGRNPRISVICATAF